MWSDALWRLKLAAELEQTRRGPAWGEPDSVRRQDIFAGVAADAIRFRDRFSLTDGLSDLVAHIGAYQRFMPGMHLERRGDVRHCQGTVLADWVVLAMDGRERMTGTNVFTLDADGRIESVTGFMTTAPASA